MIVLGGWAFLEPSSFAEFISYAPYNRHLVHDAGRSRSASVDCVVALAWNDALLVALTGFAVASGLHDLALHRSPPGWPRQRRTGAAAVHSDRTDRHRCSIQGGRDEGLSGWRIRRPRCSPCSPAPSPWPRGARSESGSGKRRPASQARHYSQLQRAHDRGIGVSTASDGLDTSVGVYVDGVYLGRPGMALTDRLRVEGTTNLLAAAQELGARRFLTQSFILGYGYRPATGRIGVCRIEAFRPMQHEQIR